MKSTSHILDNFAAPAGRARKRGFTLVETQMAGAIGTLLMLGIMTTYIFSMKSFRAITNYSEIHTAGRRAVDIFTRDMQATSAITSFSPSNLVVSIPTAFGSTGNVLSNKTVNYWAASGVFYRAETANGTNTTQALAGNVSTVTFNLYNTSGNATTLASSAKGVEVSLGFAKTLVNQQHTENHLSARIDMRNKP